MQACRMSVELGLNRYISPPPPNETELQLRERRNRERTYLVLFVHDRSLSMQTGRQWMLPEVGVLCTSDRYCLTVPDRMTWSGIRLIGMKREGPHFVRKT